MKNKKILCVCRGGHVRSVATKYCLNRRGYKEVIAVGGEYVSFDTMCILCDWADIILLAKPNHKKFIPVFTEFIDKVNLSFSIGEDTYGTPVNWKLEELIDRELDKIGL